METITKVFLEGRAGGTTIFFQFISKRFIRIYVVVVAAAAFCFFVFGVISILLTIYSLAFKSHVFLNLSLPCYSSLRFQNIYFFLSFQLKSME